ncbi:MAG: Mur ligase family protein [Candidatus Glassbacteria bacterium]
MTEIEVKDSRRLTGPNLLWDRAGAGLEVFGPDEVVEPLISSWRKQARRMLDAVGWKTEDVATRRFPGGATLALSAPMDALYSATEINEWAVEAARAVVEGERLDSGFDEEASRIREEIAGEINPPLSALQAAASDHGVSFLCDDEYASIGLGKGSLTFPVHEIPDPESIDWSRIHDIPLALITGTNGKSTTVRLLASISRAHGMAEGFSSTDGIIIDAEIVEQGDYSGPEGARCVLRNQNVEVAILEIARGGILRRGLPVRHADVALVTNVAEDHLGEYGVTDLAALVETKLIVHRAIGPNGLLVLCADDSGLRARGKTPGVPTAWFSLDSGRSNLMELLGDGGEVAWVEDGFLVRSRGVNLERIVQVDEIPITLGGAARHNIANALAAVLVAGKLNIPAAAISLGLKSFDGTPQENPGRGNVFELGGVTAIVDFAHNAHGFRSLFEMADALPARRWLVLFGQAGDRTDASILEQVAITWKAHPDRVIIKEMDAYLRGREKGEVTGLIESELRRLGAGDDMIGRADSEIEAVRQSLQWARPGDLLLLLVYSERKETFELLQHLQEIGWRPGERLPD